LSHDPQTAPSPEHERASTVTSGLQKKGVRTHILLVLAMALVIVIVTSLFLVLLRHRLRAQVTGDLSQDLKHSVVTFEIPPEGLWRCTRRMARPILRSAEA